MLKIIPRGREHKENESVIKETYGPGHIFHAQLLSAQMSHFHQCVLLSQNANIPSLLFNMFPFLKSYLLQFKITCLFTFFHQDNKIYLRIKTLSIIYTTLCLQLTIIPFSLLIISITNSN